MRFASTVFSTKTDFSIVVFWMASASNWKVCAPRRTEIRDEMPHDPTERQVQKIVSESGENKTAVKITDEENEKGGGEADPEWSQD